MEDVTQSEGQPSEQELVRKFAKGEIGIEEMPVGLKNKLLRINPEPIKTEPEPATAEPEAQPEDKSSAEPSAEAPKPAEEPAKPEPRKKKSIEDLRKIALERADKINALEQANANHIHRMKTDPVYRSKWLTDNSVPAEAPKAKPNIWDDEHHIAMAERQERLEKELEEMRVEKQMQGVYSTMERFALKQGHEFEAPISEIDKAARLIEASGKKATDGLKEMGYDERDVQMYETLVGVQNLHAQGYSLDAALFEYRRLNGGAPVVKVEREVPDFESDDRAKRKARMEQVLAHPATLPNQRAMGADTGITPEFARNWMASHQDVSQYTAEDQAMLQRIQATVLGRKVR